MIGFGNLSEDGFRVVNREARYDPTAMLAIIVDAVVVDGDNLGVILVRSMQLYTCLHYFHCMSAFTSGVALNEFWISNFSATRTTNA